MWSMDTLWFDATVVLGIFAVGNILFGHFEAHRPKWRRLLKVEVWFNEEVKPIDPGNEGEEPLRPTPPNKPRGKIERMALGLNFPLGQDYLRNLSVMPSSADRIIQAFRSETPNVRGPWISKGDEPVASWHIRRLKHLESVRLQSITLLRRSLEVKGAKINYRMHAANLPDLVEGSFSFGFQTSVEPGGERRPQEGT